MNTDLSGAVWHKSSRSDMSGPNCVEVATVGDVVAVRDSKDPAGSVLRFTRHEWRAFLDGARRGDFDRD
ncbi:MAG TPA: DUF397 domain-containing protein [Micromonosporaceae bacterium]|jgi:Domain of unknown function (DUF397)